MKKFVLVLVLLGVLGVGFKLCGREAPPVEVQTERVERRDLRAVVNGTGQVRPKVSVDLSSDVMGRVLAVPVREGEPIERGQVLVRIDSSQLEAKMTGLRAAAESARASLEQARANRERIQKTYERQANMHKQKLVSEADWESTQQARDNAIASERVARAALAQSEAALQEAENTLAKYTLVAPMSGILTRKNIEPGEMAVAGTLSVPGTLLMTISDLSVMEVEIEIDEIDIVHVRLGQDARVSVDAYPDRTWSGKVTEVGTSALETLGVTDQAKNFRVVITLTDTGTGPSSAAHLLKPGLSASADIVTATRQAALAIPIQALTVRSGDELQGDATPPPAAPVAAGGAGTASAAASTADEPRTPSPDDTDAPSAPPDADAPAQGPEAASEPGATAASSEPREFEGVFLVQDGVARFRPVELGIAGELHFEVLAGLEGGETLVAGPYETLRKLKDGQPVREKGKTAPGSPGGSSPR